MMLLMKIAVIKIEDVINYNNNEYEYSLTQEITVFYGAEDKKPDSINTTKQGEES